MKYKSLFLLLFYGILTTACPSQTGNAMKIIEAYVTAFNSGEAAMRNFLTDNISDASLKQRPLEVRLPIYRQMKGEMGELTLQQIQENTNTSITALMHTKNGEWFLFTFELEQEPPHKIIGIRIENTDEPESTTAPKVKEIEALQSVAQFLDEKTKRGEFSGTVLIAKNGKAILKRAYGMASKEFKVINRIDTKFNLGSINKIFTTIAIGQLYEQGKISLNDPIIKFLPNYPNKTAAQKVIIRHLLDMTSGIGDFFGEKFENTPKDKLRTIDDFLPMFANDSLKFEPGSQRQYSNGGYIVLGAIIEKISGESYYDYVREHIFKPTGMLNTESYEADIPVPNLAEGYTREETDKPWRNNIYTRPARGSSAGGGYSTAEDLLMFTVALEKNTFFKNPETWETLRGEPSGQKSRRQGGLGFFGGAPGINSGIETNIGKGFTAIVMSNYDPPTAEDVMKKIRKFLMSVK